VRRTGPDALLLGVQAPPEPQQAHDGMWQSLVEDAWRRSQEAAAAGQPAAALLWLERAHRMTPGNGAVAAALSGALLQAGDPARAAALFRPLAQRDGMPEAWAGLAASHRMLGEVEQAVEAMAAALRCSVPSPLLPGMGAAIAADAGLPGWCGLDGDGVLHAGPARPVRVRLDDAPIRLAWTGRRARLPPEWTAARLVHVEGYLGSPLPVAAFLAVEGFVEARDGGLAGWAWRPADPSRRPNLVLAGGDVALSVAATEPADGVLLQRPMARPWAFSVPASAFAGQAGPVSVRGADGRHLLGSPVDPGLERRAAAALARAVRDGGMPAWADAGGGLPATATVRPAVDVVIPAYRGLRLTLDCIASVLATVPRTTHVVVVDDASPEPELAKALQALHRRRRIRLIRHTENLGFPAAANTGLRACAGRDAVLLNSDTLVAPGWLERLRAAAYAAPDIGTATPLSNDATILSYPDRDGGNLVPDAAGVAAADALAQAVNGDAVADLPTGVGFCLYLRRDCLDQVGLFREDCFAQGYGEENDLCLRARHLGWRSVAALGVFVGHVGGASFGDARRHLIARNLRVLNRLHPGYDALVAAHEAADPLAPARRRMDERRWAGGRHPAGAVVLVTHGGGGGVERIIAERCDALVAERRRPVVLRPVPDGCRIETPGAGFPNLCYAVPDELPALARLLRADRVHRVEVHHHLGHQPGIGAIAKLLRAPTHAFIHDYARFCPRIALVGTNRGYCGEPDTEGCEACIADLGSKLKDGLTVPALIARSAAELAAAELVIAPSADAATRIRRHFPAVRPVVRPWEDDAILPPPDAAAPGAARHVCVIGAIGLEKGYDVLLACARDARRRGLPIRFTVVGYTSDDERLMSAGPVFVTGEYRDAEAVALIRAQAADLSFLPSVWPETWCFALSRAWQAGLQVAAFDLGAPAERLRATGRGWLLPLGLPPAAVNDALLRLPARRGGAACTASPALAMVASNPAPPDAARPRNLKRT